MNKVKNLYAGLILCGTLCIIGSSNAEVIRASNYTIKQLRERCQELSFQARDRCYACFFGGLCEDNCTYREYNEIKFNTSDNSCEDIDNGDEWSVFFTYDDCADSWLASSTQDACQYCMWGGYSYADKQIVPLDEGVGEIIFRALDNDVFECQVPDIKYISCASGWYGKAYFDDSEPEWFGCTRCPDNGKDTINTRSGGQTNITDCYIQKNETFSDKSGKYIYTDNCYYTK